MGNEMRVETKPESLSVPLSNTADSAPSPLIDWRRAVENVEHGHRNEKAKYIRKKRSKVNIKSVLSYSFPLFTSKNY